MAGRGHGAVWLPGSTHTYTLIGLGGCKTADHTYPPHRGKSGVTNVADCQAACSRTPECQAYDHKREDSSSTSFCALFGTGMLAQTPGKSKRPAPVQTPGGRAKQLTLLKGSSSAERL